MDLPPYEPVLAEVLLRSPGGTALARTNTPVTAANVIQFYSSDDIVHAAMQRLQALGFDVVQHSPLGLTIRANKSLFERVFRTQLAGAPAPPARGGPAHPAPQDAGAGEDQVAPQSDSSPLPQPDREPGAATGWQALQPLTLPPSLRDVVEDVVLPTPMSFHV